MEERIPVSGPWITQKEIDYAADAAATAWYSQANKYNARFEAAFAAYVGRRFAISLPSCTSGLHLALLAAGVGPGDEVIVPDATWIASAAPISYVGAQPVFADMDARSWCLDAASFEANISPRTKAVIVVNLYGNMPDMEALIAVAERHGIVVIEDAAESIGSEYKGRRAGSFGAASTFSFHGSKTLTTGEGGMLVTDDPAFYERCLVLRDHGRQPGDTLFFNTEVAYKYKMSSLQAALGLAQLERVEELITRKREIFGWYRACLENRDGITLNHEAPDVKNTYWMVTTVFDPALGLNKIDVLKRLGTAGIDCRPFFHPLSSIPAYRDLPQAETARRANETTYRIAPHGINLPSGFNMNEALVERVVAELNRVLATAPGRNRV